MSVLVYTESLKGKFKKNAYEVASFAHDLAQKLGTSLTAVTINAEGEAELGNFGVDKVLKVASDKLEGFNAKAYAHVLAQAVQAEGSKIIVLGSSVDAKYLAPILSAKLAAGYAPNVVAAVESTTPFVVKRSAFSNKGFAHTEISSEIKIIGLANNAYGVVEHPGTAAVETFSADLGEGDFNLKSLEVDRVVGKATIADADIIVSGGRGLKGPENWGMLEELAQVLGAATACSKPVSDLGWRPHSEHVGQTGKPVASNLYIAIGISGAIQHLAGVNAAKTKVVINNDPEAPFFKAADYGIVGDAFEVVPKLIEKLKEFKAQNA